MKFKVNGNVLEIDEPIITIQDSQEIISAIQNITSKNNTVIINLKNTFSFPSNVIGVLEKLKDEKKTIKIFVFDDIIYELFKDLGLDKIFTIIKEQNEINY